MLGHRFTKFTPDDSLSTFDKMLKLFMELLNYTAGDADEALSWLNELDRKYKFTNKDYGMGDFINDLKEQGYIRENEQGEINITPKSEQTIRKKPWKKFLEN